MADHDVAEESNPNGNEAIETEENAGQDASKTAEDSSDDMAAMDGVRGAIDEQDEGIAEDLDDAVADDHLVHPVLLLLHDDYHRPGVQGEGEEKNGKGNPKEGATWGLRMIFSKILCFVR